MSNPQSRSFGASSARPSSVSGEVQIQVLAPSFIGLLLPGPGNSSSLRIFSAAMIAFARTQQAPVAHSGLSRHVQSAGNRRSTDVGAAPRGVRAGASAAELEP